MTRNLLVSAVVPACIAFQIAALPIPASGQGLFGGVRGVTRDSVSRQPLAQVRITAHNVSKGTERTAISGLDGTFHHAGTRAGIIRYGRGAGRLRQVHRPCGSGRAKYPSRRFPACGRLSARAGGEDLAPGTRPDDDGRGGGTCRSETADRRARGGAQGAYGERRAARRGTCARDGSTAPENAAPAAPVTTPSAPVPPSGRAATCAAPRSGAILSGSAAVTRTRRPRPTTKLRLRSPTLAG